MTSPGFASASMPMRQEAPRWSWATASKPMPQSMRAAPTTCRRRVHGAALHHQQIEVSRPCRSDGLAQQHCEHHDQQSVAHVLRGAAGAEEKDAERAVAVDTAAAGAGRKRKRNQEHDTSQRQETPHRRCPLRGCRACRRFTRPCRLARAPRTSARSWWRTVVARETDEAPSDGSRFSSTVRALLRAWTTNPAAG